MSATPNMLTLRYVLGTGWFIIGWTNGEQRELGGPFASVEVAIGERAKLAAAFDQEGAVQS